MWGLRKDFSISFEGPGLEPCRISGFCSFFFKAWVLVQVLGPGSGVIVFGSCASCLGVGKHSRSSSTVAAPLVTSPTGSAKQR